MTISIVLLFGSEADAGLAQSPSSDRSKLQAIIEEASEGFAVTVISQGLTNAIPGTVANIALADAPSGPVDTVLRALGAFALRRRFASFPLGRLLNSLGPVDQGRVFWRAVRRDPQAFDTLRNADFAIAADLPAAKTAWIAKHRNFVGEAHFDPRSAVFVSGL